MKLKVSKEYFRRLKKILKSKLNGGNLVQRVSTWVASPLRYSAAFTSWRKCGLQAVDRKTRKLLTIYGRSHQKSGVGRLHIPRKDGGRCLIAIEDCVELVVRGWEVYDHESEKRLLQAAGEHRVDGLEAEGTLKKTQKEKKLQDWEEKAPHDQYLR